ncbi:glutamate receptor ionotropic, delta-2-like [Cherax quadricarinatus]|uniref:glutamate receptor ionotropic, delta-2-like n=1 Tax=Cherax quadricarinatus TaxID=27406 RepID=UPI00387EE2A5
MIREDVSRIGDISAPGELKQVIAMQLDKLAKSLDGYSSTREPYPAWVRQPFTFSVATADVNDEYLDEIIERQVKMAATVMLLMLCSSVAASSLFKLPQFDGEKCDLMVYVFHCGYGSIIDSNKVLSLAREAIHDILATTTSFVYGTLIYLTDGNTSASTLFTEIEHLDSSWAVGVMEVKNSDGTTMPSTLRQVISEARKLRLPSRQVTVMVVSDDPVFLAAFTEWSLKGRLFVWSTRLVVVTRLTLPQLQGFNKMFSMTNSVILVAEEVSKSFRCAMYVHMPYSCQGPLKVASWTPHRGLVLTSKIPLFPGKFSKLYNGPRLIVAAEEFEPHIALVKDPDISSSNSLFTGPMVNLLEILASVMNFTYTYVRPSDGSWGVKLADGSWTGMVGMVGRGEADIGLGPFGMSATRAEMVDFTREILTETARIMGGRGRPEVDPWGFLLPLTPLVWLATFTTLLLLPTLVYFMSLSGLKTTSTNVWSIDMFFVYISIFLQQECLMVPKHWWERLMVATWLVTMFVISKSYAGNLMSNLAVRYIPQPYQSLRDVLDDPSVTMIWETNTAYVQYFRSVETGIFREVAGSEKSGRIKYVRGAEFSSNMDHFVRRGDHVIIAENRYEKVLMAQDFSAKGRCDFYSSSERFMPFMSSMVGQKDSPLVSVISNSIKSVTQTGLYDYWTQAYMPNATSCEYPPTKITVNTSLAFRNLWDTQKARKLTHENTQLNKQHFENQENL